MNRITLFCGRDNQRKDVAKACHDTFDFTSFVEMVIDCGTIDDLKSIARTRAHHALENAPHSCSLKIGMGISGNKSETTVLSLIIEDGTERIEIVRLTTQHNLKKDCLTLLRKCLAFL